jgi:hypothetical protein
MCSIGSYLPYYWTFLFYPQTYKVFGNLIGLGVKQKCPVVWLSNPVFPK